MPPSMRLNYLIVALVIVASAVIGLAIPVSSGGGLPWGRRPTPVTLLPTLTLTPSPTPTEAPEPVFAPLPTDTPTLSLTLTPSLTPPLALTATAAATAPLTASVALTVTPGVTATMAITETAPVTLTTPVTATAVVTASAPPTAAETPTAAPTAAAVSLTIRLQDATQTVRVRGGPDTTYPVVGQARAGDVFAVVGRDEGSVWWQVCCLADGGRGWVRGDLGVISGAAESVPVVAVPPPPTQ